MTQQGMDGRSTAAEAPGLRSGAGAWGCFLPYILLAGLAAVWSVGWFWLQNRANSEIDAWLSREAAAGRTGAATTAA